MADMYFENLPSTNTPLIASNLDKLNDIKVSATEPNTGEKVWLQKGKNWFNRNTNKLQQGLWTSTSGTISSNTSGYYVVCPIEGGKTYTISKKNTTGSIYCTTTNIYPYNGAVEIDTWQGSSSIDVLTYQTSSNAKFLFIGLFGGSPTDAQKAQCIEELMVEQNTQATEYEEYVVPRLYTKNNNNNYEAVIFDDTGWVDITLENGVTARENNMLYKPQVRRIGKMVYLKGQVTIPTSSSSRRIALIPEGFRPSYEVGFPRLDANAWINTSGSITMVPNSSVLNNQQMFTSWLVE